MIAYLRGQLVEKTPAYAIILAGGVGYKVFAGESLLASWRAGQEAEAYIHHQVKEDASDLYGFRSLPELELFESLLTVSGVGPKSALGIIAMAAQEDVREAIARGDAGLLTKVSGIGKKTAERIVLELRNKVLSGGSGLLPAAGQLSGGDEIDALMTLGYSLEDAREALNQVDPSLKDSGARVKAALKKMARR